MLTKQKRGGIIVKLSARDRCGIQKSLEKIFQKKFEKGIDKVEEMWYNSQAVAQEGAAKLMVIEN